MNKSEYIPESFTHPGITLKDKLMELGMGAKEFALRTGKPEKTISAILNGDSSITADMAVKFENVLKIPARFWMGYQQKYNELIAKKKFKQEIIDSMDWANLFPYKEMAKLGWVESSQKSEEKAERLLKFFGFSSHKAWKNYYFEQKLKVAFRISLKHTKESPAISAWLRQGEILAAQIKAPEYNQKKFKSALKEIKQVAAEHPDDFSIRLRNICINSGVKVVFTPCLPKAPVSSCTRWLNNAPLIQLSARYKSNDIFWFTFFHEAAHIILHGKKDIFLESNKYWYNDKIKEQEADEFASNLLLTKEAENEIVSSMQKNKFNAEYFAREFQIHPAVIIGRLQQRGLIEQKEGKEYFKEVKLV